MPQKIMARWERPKVRATSRMVLASMPVVEATNSGL